MEAREQIFAIHAREMSISRDIDISQLAEKTDGCTGADIKAICTEAGMFAIREDRDKVLAEDFIKAIDKVTGIPFQKGEGSPGSMFA